MAQRTIGRLYDRYDTALAVVRDLEAAGVPFGDITLLANAERERGFVPDVGSEAEAEAEPADTGSGGAGAVVGTILGGGAGLLAGIGSLAIPGLGPVVAAGWLVATLTGAGIGAAGGGLIGALTGSGVSENEATVYAEGIRRGGTLVSVRAEESELHLAEAVFARYGADDWQQRRTAYDVNEASMPLGGRL
jgi:hypothetical protein